MSQSEKAELIYELVLFACNNVNIQAKDSPKVEVLNLIKSIVHDSVHATTSRNMLIRELKKHKSLFDKVIPYLDNWKFRCKTEVSISNHTFTCNHYRAFHKDGICKGVQYDYHTGKYVSCPCTSPNISKTKW